MFNIIQPGTKFDFMKQSSLFGKISIGVFIASLLLIAIRGVNLGLDFSGGHEILLQFDKEVSVNDVRSRLEGLFPGVDTSVQTYESEEVGKTLFLTRILRSESFGQQEIDGLKQAFQSKYGDSFSELRYNPESGDVVEVEFAATASTADTSTLTLAGVVEGTNHKVREVTASGREGQLRYSIVLKGVDVTVINEMKNLDPSATAVKVDFVGPAVGEELRNDGVLSVLIALLLILIYIAFRFDLYYSPGAIVCLFHDAVITVGILTIAGQQFNLATIAGILTLVGYSINDTIVVFDRIRETIGQSQGKALVDVLNRAINETLGRTIMTSLTTLLPCLALMFLGRGTVLQQFGLIMFVGILIGTYSSIYVATPVYRVLREKYGPQDGKPARA